MYILKDDVISLPSCYTGAMDGRATPWDGNSYAFLGDVTQWVINTVELPANAFRTIVNVQAKTSDYIATHLNLVGNKGLPNLPAEDPEATIVTTRQVMYLPYCYVPMLLNPPVIHWRRCGSYFIPLSSRRTISCHVPLCWNGSVPYRWVPPFLAMLTKLVPLRQF